MSATPSQRLTVISFSCSTNVASRVFIQQFRDPIHHPVEGFLLPLIAARRPVQRLRDAGVVDRELKGRRPLRAQGAFSMRAIRVTLDVDDLVVRYIDELGAPHRTVGTDSRDRLRVLDAKRGGRRLHWFDVEPEASERAYD